MPEQQMSLFVPHGGGGCRSLSEEEVKKRKSSSDDGVEERQQVKVDVDDVPLTLSLGSICGDTTGARSAAALPDDDRLLPATPTLPAPLRPVDGATAPTPVVAAKGNKSDLPLALSATGTLSSADFALGLAASVIANATNGNGGDGRSGSAFLSAGPHLTTTSKLEPTTAAMMLPSFPAHFPFSVIPVRGIGDVFTTPARTRSLIEFLPLLPPAASSAPPPTKRQRVATNRLKPSSSNSGGSSSPSTGGGGGLFSAETHHHPPFPWAKKGQVAEHYSLAELAERGIATVGGEVRCKRCGVRKTLSLDVAARFRDLSAFVARNLETMDDRAPDEWMDPVLPDCDKCGQRNSLRPIIPADKDRINWMFLLLGQTLGLCTIDQLKHFCAHTNKHRTGAKDRVLYSTYMELCKQLCPDGPFDVTFERMNRNGRFV